MIVKVQASLVTTEDSQQILIYNKDKSAFWQGPATSELLTIMNGRPKAFFSARIVKKKIMIDSEAKWQNW